jgi:hypothetical protein
LYTTDDDADGEALDESRAKRSLLVWECHSRHEADSEYAEDQACDDAE